MGFFSRSDEIGEIIIRDSTGKKLEHHKFNALDKRTQKNIGTKIYLKYGIDLTPEKKGNMQEETSWIDINA